MQMKIKISALMASLVVASASLLASTVAMADEWFVLGTQTLNAANPSATIKSEGGRWDKDVKKVKVSAEGADVEISNLVLEWDNRKDNSMPNLGVIKAGGETASTDAPGRKGRLIGVQVQYKILGGAKSATLKVWGYD